MKPTRMSNEELREAHAELRKLVGARAYHALAQGRPLIEWRRSSPHNWFIPVVQPEANEFLWHSEDYYPERKLPDLRLFSRRVDVGPCIGDGLPPSSRLLIGRDAGASEEAHYYLIPITEKDST